MPTINGSKTDLNEFTVDFETEDLRRMEMRFRKLDADNSGGVSIDEFLRIPSLRVNPVVNRVIEIMDDDSNGEVDFKEFVKGLSQFSSEAEKDSKTKFIFKIYDLDGDGYISNGDLFKSMKEIIPPISNLKDTQLQQLVDKTIIYADKTGDGRISFQEFKDIARKWDFFGSTNADT